MSLTTGTNKYRSYDRDLHEPSSDPFLQEQLLSRHDAAQSELDRARFALQGLHQFEKKEQDL
ncbi:hypothetical protein BGZ76_005253, partial [Entomortierella beljakovae]